MPPIVAMRSITKRFTSVVANDHIHFDCEAGEIHALLGENGAGKTTLMNVLYGLLKPDEGSVSVGGREVNISSPRRALQLGIGMIHQHFMLVPWFTVLENVILGIPPTRGPFLDRKTALERLKSTAERYGLAVDPTAIIWQLSVSAQQKVEITKLLYRGARVLILDEPTALLAPPEVHELFGVLRSLAASGHSIIFISHKLNEVMEISDRVTVLRAGRVVSTRPTAEADPHTLAKEIVGRDLLGEARGEGAPGTKVVLRVAGLRARDDRRLLALNGIDLEVHEGEIVGVAGVDGNGQSELAQVLTGLRPVETGRIEVGGHDLSHADPWSFIMHGVAHVPEDRQRDGLVMNFSLAENLVLQMHGQRPFAAGGFIKKDAIRKNAVELMREFDVRAPHPDLRAEMLSGGNQQRLVLARELSRSPGLLIASHPTRGLDVASVEHIHRNLLAARQRGSAILLISHDLDELLALSDRIAVIYRGQIVGLLPTEKADIELVGLLMTGATRLTGGNLDVEGHGASGRRG